MSFESRGGIPIVVRRTAANGNAVTTSGVQIFFQTRAARRCNTKWVQVSNEGANVLRVYFTQADFDANDNDGFVDLPATTGFFEGPVEEQQIWLRAVVGNSDVVVIGYARKG